MEWQAPAIVLDVRRHGENDAVATLLSEAEGRHRGLVRGGQSRRQAATWQVGSLVAARWTGRLADQLGHFTAELVHPSAALVLDSPLALALLAAACAVAEGALPEALAAARDFADTAAVVMGLDLVITVDTSVAHLAGGLGKPVWLLSRFDGCWRWLRERQDSPWYPTLRLYRQPSPGDWAPAIAALAADLAQLTAHASDAARAA